MHRFGRVAAIAMAAMVVAASVAAGSTRSQAEAVVNQGIKLFEEKGPQEAIRVVNERKKPFLDGDLYLFVIGPDGKIVAHAYDESRIGMAANELYDEHDQPYGKLMLKLANEEGVWIPYRQFNPVTRKVEPKQSLVRKVNGYIFGCGVYGE